MENKISFSKQNYIIIGIGVLVVVLGFILMSGGGSEDPSKWNPEIFSFRRITLAPITVMLGYVIVVVGIMRKNKNQETPETNLEA